MRATPTNLPQRQDGKAASQVNQALLWKLHKLFMYTLMHKATNHGPAQIRSLPQPRRDLDEMDDQAVCLCTTSCFGASRCQSRTQW